MGQKVAIVGAGISGLGAAWTLAEDHDVTVYEARPRVGGHSNTYTVPTADGPLPVDTGFIVYNEATYPHLTSLFALLDVPTQPSDMSFAFSLDREFEYGATARGMAQLQNLGRRRYRSMIRDIVRFRREGEGLLAVAADATIGDLLATKGYSDGFIDDYLLPMAGAIWSARSSEIRRYPAAAMLRFLANHGLIQIVGRPAWRTVTGGSIEYVRRLIAGFSDRIRTSTPVVSITRHDTHVDVVTNDGGWEEFDHVILATHSDQALRVLGDDASPEEHEALAAIRYEPNVAVLHSDPALMPRRRKVWSSWNAMVSSDDREDRVASVTYWMNRLQDIDQNHPMFVSLNPLVEPDPTLVHARFEYAHPQFDPGAVEAQHRLSALQGRRRTWFAGAYHGYGFHEDGLQSGLHVAAALGSPAPWYDDVEPRSSAPRPVVNA